MPKKKVGYYESDEFKRRAEARSKESFTVYSIEDSKKCTITI